MRAKVVTAYVPLEVKHLTRDQYLDYGSRLADAVGRANIRVYHTPLEECWLYKLLNAEYDLKAMLPATEVPADRYATPLHMVYSNIVQHQRTHWLMQAMYEFPDIDTFIWLDLAILKQGGWTGKPVTEEIVRDFFLRVSDASPLNNIPFPGIWPQGPIDPKGPNWRFCGSTHIIPKTFLPIVNESYIVECRSFIQDHGTIPLDLPIWAAVERNSLLPFDFYPANHDATQLTNFPR